MMNATDKRLTRSQTNKMLGGVCGGLGEYFDIDPTLIRILFALLIVFGLGSPILLYALLWIIIPAGSETEGRTGDGEAERTLASRTQTDVAQAAERAPSEVIR